MCYFGCHNHSMYSNLRMLDSINKPEEMIRYANDIGLRGICLSDHECLSGHVKFIKSYKELKEKGDIRKEFRIGLGNEIYLVHENTLEELKENYKNKNPDTKFYHFLLIAKDETGYEQLRILSSKAWENMFSTGFMERVPTFKSNFTEILKGGHVVGTSACLGGFIPQMILKWKEAEKDNNQEEITKRKILLNDFINFCVDVLGKENFYLEIQPSHQEEQKNVNKVLIELSKVFGIKYIIATDGHYLKKEDRQAHKIYLQSQEGEREVDDFYQSAFVMNEDEVRELMIDYLTKEEIEEGFNNTLEILSKIKEFDLAKPTVIPSVKIDEFEVEHIFEPVYSQYEYIQKFAESPYEIDQYYFHLIEEGFNEKIANKPLTKEYVHKILDRVNIELGELWKISEKLRDRISSYYVLTKRIVDLIWSKGDSLCGVSRGSSAGYLTNYLIGIIQENPLDYNLPHFRHLTAERPELPDIDLDSQQNRRGQILQALKDEFGEQRVLNIATFGTEGSRSALLAVCRGMGIDVDVAHYLTSFIKSERGQNWSLHDCIYGNPEKDREPIKELIRELEKYDGLIETALKIENLVKSRSVHASGVYVYNDDYTKFNAMMKTSSGQPITAYDMKDSDYQGNLKVDMLTIQALDRIRTAMEMLIRDGFMEWKGTLRDTYNKYLHPDVLNYDDQDMWRKVGENAILDLFQFDTPVGLQCAKKIQPTNVVELAVANSLMRLMPDNEIQPVDKYVSHKNNPEEWQREMMSYGLTEEEIKIVRKHLDEVYGVSESQELMMLLSMDENIANFSIQESNKLRKGVSKKLEKVIAKAKEEFFEKGNSNGTSENLLNYIWNTQIQPQCGYSFSRLHSVGYSLIGLQEMNIAHFYPQLYWDTACLTIKAGADEDNEDNKGTNYGKMASAIGIMQERGVKIALPDINSAKLSFSPDIENNQIIYGLKGITNLSDSTIQAIIDHRPYKNLKDFHERLVLTKQEVMLSNGKKQMRSLVPDSQLINLIKAGCFDNLENKERQEILEEYIKIINPPKIKLNAANIDDIIELGIVPDELSIYTRYHRFKNYLNNNEKIQDESSKSIKWHCLSNRDDDFYEYASDFFNDHFANLMIEGKDYYFDNDGLIWIALGTSRKGSFNDILKQKMNEFNTWLNSIDCLNRYNSMLFTDIKSKYMQGSISKWEMDSMCFYYSPHPLSIVDKDKYGISNFFDLSEKPNVVEYMKWKNGNTFPKYQIYRIFGTVLDKDKNKGTISLLTPEGVVSVKFQDGQFSFYDKTISKIDEDSGKKVTLEKSWLERGSLLVISGYRKDKQFKPKRYKNSIFQHTLQKIIRIEDDGSLILQSERHREEDD